MAFALTKKLTVLVALTITSTVACVRGTNASKPAPSCGSLPGMAADPFTSLSRTTPWPIDFATLDLIVRTQTPGPMTALKGLTVQQKATSWSGDEALGSYLADVNPIDARGVTIRGNLRTFLASADAAELKFAYVGQAHAIDLYLSTPDLSVAYWAKPFALDTLTQSAEFRQINDELKVKTPALTINDNSLEYFAMPYSYALETTKQLGAVTATLPARHLAKNVFPHAVVIHEIHGLVSVDWVKQMPDPSCLASAGIKRVSLGLEGFAAGRQFTLEDVLYRTNMLEQFEFRANRLKKTNAEIVAKLFTPALASKILSGQVDINPGLTALIRKLIEYRAAGLSIELFGLEAPDYDELGH